MCCLASKRWDTRTRTKNDRTRICSVTITPYPNACFCTAKLLLFSYLPNDLLTFLPLYKAGLLWRTCIFEERKQSLLAWG